MKTRKSLPFALAMALVAIPFQLSFTPTVFAAAQEEEEVVVQEDMTLIYPTTATAISELDSSTPSKRTEPPVRETSEYDPSTPIGQIRRVLETLDKLEADNANLQARLQGLEKIDALIPLLEKDSERAEYMTANLESLLQSSRLMGGKIDDLKRTTENLRATVEAAQKTAASIESIRKSRWTDCAVLTILIIVLVQLSYRVIVGVYQKIKFIAKALEVANSAIQTELREAKTSVKKMEK
jgi:hypothetical protein